MAFEIAGNDQGATSLEARYRQPEVLCRAPSHFIADVLVWPNQLAVWNAVGGIWKKRNCKKRFDLSYSLLMTGSKYASESER